MFGLFLQADPASAGQTQLEFCGNAVMPDLKPCSAGVFDRPFSGFEPNVQLLYRFERATAAGDVQIISAGQTVADGGLIEIDYP